MCLTVESRHNYFLSTLYTASFVKSCLDGTFNSKLIELLKISQLEKYFTAEYTLEQILSEIYNHLAKNYRSEYIYKNTIANELLINKHHISEAKLFTEFSAVQSQLDVLIVNGTTTAYEIKTELDNLERLPVQLQSYQSMFDKVYVVTHERNIEKIKGIVDDAVGILVLSGNNNIETERDAISNIHRFNIENIFSALRKNEYIDIVNTHFGYTPQVPNTKIFTECLSLFKELSTDQVQTYFINALRTRQLCQYQINLIESVNYSLKILFLERNLTKVQCCKLAQSLQSHPYT
ncbi:sce7726 family protein [Arsenicibacter rosenii]|uniref:Sce7726 family protein n=1 Tax=Arsenicibacter rosenii TaxID=1750698 RepID=A0A1S2VC73_9BACT|nr:sce7726 family protein [Arsenicibacter rosenii]OIN56314.1 hypothetical protein BLX24_25100 [Arsenicibacter rosenii]